MLQGMTHKRITLIEAPEATLQAIYDGFLAVTDRLYGYNGHCRIPESPYPRRRKIDRSAPPSPSLKGAPWGW